MIIDINKYLVAICYVVLIGLFVFVTFAK